MNLAALIFTFLAYGLFVAMYQGDSTGESTFPAFEAPEVEFEDLPASCGGFTDCIEYVGNVIKNVVLGFVYAILLIVAIIRLIVELLVLIVASAFTGFDGAPEWLNILVATFFGIATAITIYRALRKGDTDTA